MNKHTHEQEPRQQQQRQPSPGSVLRVQKQKIDYLEDLHVAACAMVEDLEGENAGYRAAMSQIVIENQILRARLGIAEGEPIELSDAEEAKLEGTSAKIIELPEREGQTPDGQEAAGQPSGQAGEERGEQPVQAGSAEDGPADHVGEPEADKGQG